ncbi:MAG: Sporulation kinase A [candidate division BRC1 bacterium ADurb.BinA364]|nr:MAG: Sporulation kinase A [candidate division BRC1 bacterium ADurb.BinA364]
MSVVEAYEIEQARTEHERSIDALLQISYAVGSVMELPDILNRIVVQTADLMDADVCSIYLIDKDKNQLRLRATHGLHPSAVNNVRPLGKSITGLVAATGRLIALEDATKDPRYEPIEGAGEERLRAFLCAPLRIQTELIGVMTARMTEARPFEPTEIKVFETICKQVAIVIEKAQLYHEKVEAERLAAVALGLSEIAHYIKNLLQSVEGGAFVIEQGLQNENLDKVRGGWELMRRNTKKITGLVANMLSYSRPEEPELEKGDLNALLHEVVEDAKARAEREGVLIIEEFEPNLPPIMLDEDFLHDAFLNLVANAIDALPEEGGTVKVATRSLPAELSVMVEVKDNGCGIPEEARDRIFSLFFSTKGSKGSGIGLAATKKRIEAHGGAIGFESERDKGTTFWVRLPASKA